MIRLLEFVMNSVVVIVMAAVLLLGLYVVYDSNMVTKSADLGAEIERYAPVEDDYDFEKWRIINSNIIGWIIINGTSIDYPILQSSDNDYYLSRNYLDEYATAGSIFLDYRHNILTDRFLIIYGHRMTYGKMFSDVTKYHEREYFYSHLDGSIYDKHGRRKLIVIGFAKIRADAKEIYGSFSSRSIDYLEDNALFWRDDESEKYLLLSTCDADDKSMRDVLLLKIDE